MSGALAGLRVIDNTNDAGRFGTKLLTEFGADVVRISTRGSSGTELAGAAGTRGGVLDWWYDGGKRSFPLDLSDEADRSAYRLLAASADLVLETEAPGTLSRLGIDHGDLLAENPSLSQVSITPFGRTGPHADWVGSDLVHAAMGGFLSVTGLPEHPLNVWGRQAYNYAGFAATVSGLAAVRSARVDGRGRHVDLSIHEAVTGTIENLFFQLFFDDQLPDLPAIARRQGALHWLRAYDVVPGRTGHVMITPTPTPDLLVDFMLDNGHEAAAEWKGKDVESMLERIDDLMACVRDFVGDHDAMELWWQAQNRHCAFGGVHDIEAVAAIPQFEHRGLFADASTDDDASVRMPARLVELSATPSPAPRPPASTTTALEELLAEWGERSSPTTRTGAAPGRPLEGLRIADFTWVLAGPFCTRLLGDLGADVIRIQNEERSTLVNRPDYPYFFVWNRSKRSATLNMKHPEALAAVRRLIEQCDVLIENYSAGVLDSWGLDWETVHEWNPRLVYVTMSGCGHDGPWKHVISYAPTVHALCGLTHLTDVAEPQGIGPGFSLNDHLAGFGAALATLAALDARDRTGVGQKVDMAQLEVGTHSIGPALIEWFANGVAPRPAGNRDGLHDHVPNEVYATADDHVAVTATDEDQWAALVRSVDGALDAWASADEDERRRHREDIDAALAGWASTRTASSIVELLQDAGVPAGSVQDSRQLFEDDPQHRDRGFWQAVHHDGFGPRHVDTFPGLIDGERPLVERLAPTYLGEHNFDVWTEIAGYEFDRVAEGMGNGLFS